MAVSKEDLRTFQEHRLKRNSESVLTEVDMLIQQRTADFLVRSAYDVSAIKNAIDSASSDDPKVLALSTARTVIEVEASIGDLLGEEEFKKSIDDWQRAFDIRLCGSRSLEEVEREGDSKVHDIAKEMFVFHKKGLEIS